MALCRLVSAAVRWEDVAKGPADCKARMSASWPSSLPSLSASRLDSAEASVTALQAAGYQTAAEVTSASALLPSSKRDWTPSCTASRESIPAVSV